MLSAWSGEKDVWIVPQPAHPPRNRSFEDQRGMARSDLIGPADHSLWWFMGGRPEILSKMKKWWPALLVVIAVLGYLRSETSSSQLLNERNISHRFAFWENSLEMIQGIP